MKTILLSCALVSSVAMAQSVTYQAPTVFQITPILETRCVKDGPAREVILTGADANGNPTGIASYWGFGCALKVHSGRGGGITINAGCADVVWDPQGNILSVTPTLWLTGSTGHYAPPCPTS